MCSVKINMEEYPGIILTSHLLPGLAASGLEEFGSYSLEITLWVSRKILMQMIECLRNKWRNRHQEKKAEWKKY